MQEKANTYTGKKCIACYISSKIKRTSVHLTCLTKLCISYFEIYCKSYLILCFHVQFSISDKMTISHIFRYRQFQTNSDKNVYQVLVHVRKINLIDVFD